MENQAVSAKKKNGVPDASSSERRSVLTRSGV